MELEKTNSDLILLQSGAASNTVSQAAMDALSRDLKQFGTGFQLLWDLFCADDDFSEFYEEKFSAPTFHPESPLRYVDEVNQALGLIAELLHFIPQRYHGQLRTSKVFAHMVSIYASIFNLLM